MAKEKTVFKHQSDQWIKQASVDSITDKRLDYFDRCLLLYMHFRFDYFTEVLKKPYFESTQTLADVFGVHRNTVSKAIQTLKSVGYIEVTTKKGGSNTYTKVTTWLNGSSPASSTNSKTHPVKAAPVQKKEIQPEKHWWEAPESEEDEDNIPF